MKAIIVGGGLPPSKSLIVKEITKDSVIIAADGGANCLWQYKITPNYLIGDFDSIDSKILNLWVNKGVITERYPAEKDFTDTELALKKAAELKAKKVVFLGCLGGFRVDHLLGVIGLLDKTVRLDIKGYLKDEYQTITLLTKSVTISGIAGAVFSLQAYGGSVKNLTITGSKYQLKDYLLKIGDSLTLSNEFTDKKASIKFTSGKLLLITFL